MKAATRAQLALHMPRRDYRFWAAISICLLVATVGVAFIATLGANAALRHDNAELNQRVITAARVNECRAAAAVFSDSASERASSIQSLALIAIANKIPLTPYTDALAVARSNALIALDARDAAVARCGEDPSFRISPTLLATLPTLPVP
jgi:hypothetical protein